MMMYRIQRCFIATTLTTITKRRLFQHCRTWEPIYVGHVLERLCTSLSNICVRQQWMWQRIAGFWWPVIKSWIHRFHLYLTPTLQWTPLQLLLWIVGLLGISCSFGNTVFFVPVGKTMGISSWPVRLGSLNRSLNPFTLGHPRQYYTALMVTRLRHHIKLEIFLRPLGRPRTH